MGIGFFELVVIALAALVLLGPQRLPEILRHIAKFYVHLRRTSNDFKSAFDHVVEEAELELKRTELAQIESEIKKQVSAEPTIGLGGSSDSQTAPRPRAAETPAWDPPTDDKPKDS